MTLDNMKPERGVLF
ncbi:unnamed protein product [Ophioblennius macclurei]